MTVRITLFIAHGVFIGFLTSPNTQKYMRAFGKEKYGRPAFDTMAVKANPPQKGLK